MAIERQTEMVTGSETDRDGARQRDRQTDRQIQRQRQASHDTQELSYTKTCHF